MLNIEPDKRITAGEALLHPFLNKNNLILNNEKIEKLDFNDTDNI